MLAGLDGHLVSSAYLEAQLRMEADASVDRAAVSLRAWRAGRAFGPASSVRAIFDAGAVPLLEALEFDPPARIEQVDQALAATLRFDEGATAVALLVVPWGTR